MAKKYKKVKYVRGAIPEELYDKFILKIRSEGWSVQEALYRLVYYYANERFDIKRTK
jgi:hypothetical protein